MIYCCRSSSLSPESEKTGLLQPRPLQGALPENGLPPRTSARRHADVFIPLLPSGPLVALDFAVTSGLLTAVVRNSIQDKIHAVTSYETSSANIRTLIRIAKSLV